MDTPGGDFGGYLVDCLWCGQGCDLSVESHEQGDSYRVMEVSCNYCGAICKTPVYLGNIRTSMVCLTWCSGKCTVI